jgi:hypothetical protein
MAAAAPVMTGLDSPRCTTSGRTVEFYDRELRIAREAARVAAREAALQAREDEAAVVPAPAHNVNVAAADRLPVRRTLAQLFVDM